MATDTLKKSVRIFARIILAFILQQTLQSRLISPTDSFVAALEKPVIQEMFTSGLSATEERMLYRLRPLLINIRIFFKTAIKKRLLILRNFVSC